MNRRIMKPCTVPVLRLSSRKLLTNVPKAGLLVYSVSIAFPILHQWLCEIETLKELTAAGTTQDLHLIPYYGYSL